MFTQLEPHLDYVEQVYFAGGEPLLMAEHYRILEELLRRGRTDTEAINTDDLAIKTDVFAPETADAGFDRHTRATRGRQNAVAIFRRLAVKAFAARHRNHACTGARAVEVAIDAWMHCRLAEGAAVLGSKAKADTDGRRERWRTWW